MQHMQNIARITSSLTEEMQRTPDFLGLYLQNIVPESIKFNIRNRQQEKKKKEAITFFLQLHQHLGNSQINTKINSAINKLEDEKENINHE